MATDETFVINVDRTLRASHVVNVKVCGILRARIRAVVAVWLIRAGCRLVANKVDIEFVKED